jgi:hypothetical protein
MEDFRIDPNIAYDVVELPSMGIYYPNKKKSVRVAYLTASDENILASENILNSDRFIDELLRRKILDRDMPIEEIDQDDKKAILVFLRNTAFGSEYTVILTDPKTEKTFEHTFNLDKLKVKDFTLIENANGEYEYKMEKSNVLITFKFITPTQQNELIKLQDNWNNVGTPPPIITKQMEYMIKSVNGNTDPLFIRNFIMNLPIKDSQEFRKYVRQNKPGLELEQTTIAPSGEKVQFNIGFGVEFFRAFFGL